MGARRPPSPSSVRAAGSVNRAPSPSHGRRLPCGLAACVRHRGHTWGCAQVEGAARSLSRRATPPAATARCAAQGMCAPASKRPPASLPPPLCLGPPHTPQCSGLTVRSRVQRPSPHPPPCAAAPAAPAAPPLAWGCDRGPTPRGPSQPRRPGREGARAECARCAGRCRAAAMALADKKPIELEAGWSYMEVRKAGGWGLGGGARPMITLLATLALAPSERHHQAEEDSGGGQVRGAGSAAAVLERRARSARRWRRRAGRICQTLAHPAHPPPLSRAQSFTAEHYMMLCECGGGGKGGGGG